MSFNGIDTLEVEKDFISVLPAEMTLNILKNLSESEDIISFALASKNAMLLIPKLSQEIVVNDEKVIKQLLRSVKGRSVVSKLIYYINTNISEGEKPPYSSDVKFSNYRHGVTIEIQSVNNNKIEKMIHKFKSMINKRGSSTFDQHDMLQEILDKCSNINEIKMKEDLIEEENLIYFNNFQMFGIPNQGSISEKDIKILSTKLPNLKNLILIRNRKPGMGHAKMQVVAPNGLVSGWSVNFDLYEACTMYTPRSTTDEKYERLVVNWESISKACIVSPHMTDRSIKFLCETNSNLKEIKLCMENLTGKGLDYLGLYCKKLHSIEMIINENVTESSMKNLLYLKNIKKLDLWEELESDNPDYVPPGISEEGFKRVLPLVKNVEEFSLRGDHLVTDNVMESLANYCQHIQRLTLGGSSRLTGAGLRRVLRATGSSLSYLDLGGCGDLLNDDEMMNIPKFCVSLEKLELGCLSETRLYSRKSLNYLKSMIKDVELLEDDSDDPLTDNLSNSSES